MNQSQWSHVANAETKHYDYGFNVMLAHEAKEFL